MNAWRIDMKEDIHDTYWGRACYKAQTVNKYNLFYNTNGYFTPVGLIYMFPDVRVPSLYLFRVVSLRAKFSIQERPYQTQTKAALYNNALICRTEWWY